MAEAYFTAIAILIAVIGTALVISDFGQIGSNFLLGITLIYESLMVYRGKIPRIRDEGNL